MLKNIHAFVKGANRDNHKLTIEEHARCSLELLQTIPAARLAALEYLCHVFDESVNSYLYEMEGKGKVLHLNSVEMFVDSLFIY